MEKLNAYFLSIRPKTLAASAGPVVIGLACSFFHTGSIDSHVALLTLLCALFLQIAANQVNDYYDYIKGIDDDQRLGPKRVTASGKLSQTQIKIGYRLSFLIALLIGIFLAFKGGTPIIVIGIVSMLFAYLYTAGPLPLSHWALGELCALIFFGPVAVLGTFYLQTGSFDHWITPSISGVGVGAIAAIIMSINNLRDRKTDKIKGKRTLANLVLERTARMIPILFLMISLIVLIIFAIVTGKSMVLIALLAPIAFIKTWYRLIKAPIDRGMNQLLANAGKYLLIYSLLFSGGMIL